MNAMKPHALALLAVMALLSSGCIPALQNRSQQQAQGVSYPNDLKTGSMKSEISRLEKIADGNYGKEQKADACLRLALMLSHYQNNSPDYSKASARLAQFEALRPDLGREDKIRHFNILLKALVERDNALQRQGDEIQRLTKTAKEMEAEIKRLGDIIEKLNLLDMQLEQKRRGTR